MENEPTVTIALYRQETIAKTEAKGAAHGPEELYQKVTVTLYERQILSLDKVALTIRGLFPILTE